MTINMFNDGSGGMVVCGNWYPEDEARALWEDGEETEEEVENATEEEEIDPYFYTLEKTESWLPVRGNVKSEDVPHLLDNSNRFGLNAHYWLNPEGDSYNFEVRSPGFPKDLDY